MIAIYNQPYIIHRMFCATERNIYFYFLFFYFYMSGLQWKNLSKKEIALLFMLSSINCLAPLFGSSLLTFVRSCLGYCIYFDRKRRSHPDFRRKLREKRKAASRGGPGSGPALPDFADQEAVQRFFLQVQPLLSLFIQQRSRNFSYRKLLKTS